MPGNPYSYTFILEPKISPFTLSFSVEAYGSSAMVGLSEDGTDQSVIIEIRKSGTKSFLVWGPVVYSSQFKTFVLPVFIIININHKGN